MKYLKSMSTKKRMMNEKIFSMNNEINDLKNEILQLGKLSDYIVMDADINHLNKDTETVKTPDVRKKGFNR